VNGLQAQVEEVESVLGLQRDNVEATNKLQEKRVALYTSLVAAKVVQSQANEKLGVQTSQTIQSLSDPDTLTRRYAATDLASLALMSSEQADAAVAALVPKLVADTATVRVAAMEAASALAPRVSSPQRAALFQALLRSTEDSNSDLRMAAIKAIGIVAPYTEHSQREEAKKALLRAVLAESDIFVLRAAAESLVAIPLSSSERAELLAQLKTAAGQTTDPVVSRALSEAMKRLQNS